MSELLRKLSWLFRRRGREAELEEEIRFHLNAESADRRDAGLNDEDARRAARLELGNSLLVREDTRAVWGWTAAQQLMQDLRYAFRAMSANRLFTGLVVLSLALGIGANTAIFSFVDSILFRSLPVADPEALVIFNWRANGMGRDSVVRRVSGSAWQDPRLGSVSGMFPFPAFELFARNDSLFSNVFAYYQPRTMRKLNFAVTGDADVLAGIVVSGNYFSGLGVAPAAGRFIMPDDDQPGAAPAVVISYGLSQRRFGGAQQAAGQSVWINNLPFTVIGVAPAGFYGVDPGVVSDVYLPMHANELLGAADPFGFRPSWYAEPNFYWVQVMGRLRAGVTMEQAQAVLAPQFQQWVAATATREKEDVDLPQLIVAPGVSGLSTLRRQYSKPLYLLMTVSALILTLACVNVASLLLARSTARRREVALRLSLGAGRRRLVRQLLTESVLLSFLGGVGGVVLAGWGVRLLTLLLANGQANFTLRAELNWHVLAAAAALSIGTGILFGLAPALRATRVDIVSTLKENRTQSSAARLWLGRVTLSRALVVTQIAISLLLLVAAGLFLRTLSNLQRIEVGFNRENILLFQLDARKTGYDGEQLNAFYAETRRRLTSIPGVQSASLSDSSHVGAGFWLPITLRGEASLSSSSGRGTPPAKAKGLMTVGPAFFATMQIPILAGRDFQESDRPGSPPVAIVNQEFVKTYFGNSDPIGERITVWNGNKPEREMQIVGVAKNARYGRLTEDFRPVVYLTYDQGYPFPVEMVYAVRVVGDPARYGELVRATVRQMNARVPVSDLRTQAADIDQTMRQEITFAVLCSAFAALALVIACVGLYGTVSYNVARRTSEIGIRVALGAQRGRVLSLILADVLVLVAAGMVIGSAAARAAATLVATFLYQMKPTDTYALAQAIAVLLIASLAAAYVPARRASRIDPTQALRHE
jgi:macrolide transport system ATP-binding/permease protein